VNPGLFGRDFFVLMGLSTQRTVSQTVDDRSTQTGEHTMSAATAAAINRLVEKWFTVADAMEITGFKRTYIYQEREAGRLRSIKAGGGRRIPESALAEWQARFNGSGEVTE
jgi:excisionase family DNA binding protein